ncbi:MAG TPA: TetR family transcriptional regulator [Trebonia sp.]|nr:TetR family transcriptional regulator [Trebonia sp.]
MITTAGSAPPAEQPSSLRERKKLATRRLLRRVALDLVAERGLASVTVEDIAMAADVSPRTFFNYFPSKEAALFGDSDPDRASWLRDQVASQAPGEPALSALRMVMEQYAEMIAGEFRALGGDPADLLRRMKVARGDPHVRGAHAAQMAMLERAITEGLAARLGASPEADPYPAVLAAAAIGVVRACISFWANSGDTVQLSHLVDQAFGALASGLPENSPLRQITKTTDKKDSL